MAEKRNTKISYEDIKDLDIDWGSNPNEDGKPFSGESVQKFIKSFLSKVIERMEVQIGEDGSTATLVGYNRAGEEVARADLPTTSVSPGEGSTGGDSGSITIDMKMSDTSRNAIANKVVKAYIDSFVRADFSKDFNNDFTN